MSAIITLGINAIYVSHISGKIAMRCLDQQMIMIGH